MIIILFTITYVEYFYNGVLRLHSAGWTGNFIISYVGAFSGILMVLAISSTLAKFKSKIIYVVSINTLTIMGLEQILRMYFVSFFKELGIKDMNPLLNTVSITLFVIITSVIVAMLLNRHVPAFIGNNGAFKMDKVQRFYLMIKNKGKDLLKS